jgi:LSD1 subclass zinc finger protein
MRTFTRVLHLRPGAWVAHVQCAVCATLLGRYSNEKVANRHT